MKRKISAESKNVKIKKKKNIEAPLEKKVLTADEREKRKTSLYRAPTSEELSELRENEDLYKNNLFRMQIQYLLEEVCLQEKKLKNINTTLHSLNTFLKGLQTQDESYDVSNDAVLPKGACLPLPELIKKSKMKGTFKFLPPKEIKVVGSFLLKTTIKSNQCVDVAVEIPTECVHSRDFLNFRYLYKRAIYLSWLASCLKDWEHTEELQYTCGCDVYKPLLKIKLKGKIGKRWSIVINTAIPEGLFKLQRYAPLRNNVRSSWYNSQDGEVVEDLEFPTPFYNTSVLRDMLYETHLHDLYNAQKECPAMKDAVCLFKVWLKQRSFKGDSPFNGFIGSMLHVYLLSARKISSHMSSYQIFRLVLHFIATSDWAKEGISLCKEELSEAKLQDFHSQFDVVFVDSSGYLNLCAYVDGTTYEMLKYQAELSLAQLDGSSIKAFDCLFIKSQSFFQNADHSFKLTNLECLELKYFSKKEELQSNVIDVGGDWTRLVPKQIVPVLKKGLGNRVHRVFPKHQKELTWDVAEQRQNNDNKTFWFGFHLNTEFSDNVLVMGPAADKPEAKEFRDFWAQKSELRRFQDGSINEAVLWNCNNQTEKDFICQKIINYLLPLHFGISSDSILYHGREFNDILCPRAVPSSSAKAVTKYTRGCGEEESLHALKTFDELSKQIRTMENVPLKINSIHPIDAAMRCTEGLTPRQYQVKGNKSEEPLLRPAAGKKSPVWCPAFKALVQFETSGKWPDDVVAVQHIKAAFHIKLAECIRSQLRLPAVATPTWVDVMKNGYVYRLSVVHYREMILYRESPATGSLKKQHDVKAKQLDLLIVKKPLHNSLLHSLNSPHRSYALTTRLAKRWIGAQMLSDYVCDEAIELIVASLYLSPAPLHAPNSHMAGFLRFLNFMAKFDWQNEPLIVNLNEQLKDEECEAITEMFTNNRVQLPPMFIATPYDQETSVWTKNNPTTQILRRIAMLAQAALDVVEDDLSKESVKQLFRPSLKDFHVLIELDKDHVPKKALLSNTSVIKTSWSGVRLCPTLDENVVNTVLPVAEFDPLTMFMKELRDAFSEVALFFYDKYGGMTIGVVWKAGSLIPQPFKAMDSKYRKYEEVPKSELKKKKGKAKIKPSKQESKRNLVLNLGAIMCDFEVMGRGLVASVNEVTKVT